MVPIGISDLTPPRKVLGDEETLLLCGCCPTAVLFFGVDGGTDGASGGRDPFLNDHVMSNLSTAAGAISWAQNKR